MKSYLGLRNKTNETISQNHHRTGGKVKMMTQDINEAINMLNSPEMEDKMKTIKDDEKYQQYLKEKNI